MHVTRIKINGVRSIDQLEWKLPADCPSGGWHVVIGDNGSGKTSFLRSIALALIGPSEPGALRQDWRSWLREDATGRARIALTIKQAPEFDRWSGKGQTHGRDIDTWVEIVRDESGAGKLLFPKTGFSLRTMWTRGVGYGWFSAGYGPFRRFEGGDQEASKDGSSPIIVGEVRGHRSERG